MLTSPCLHRSYSCDTVSPTCKVQSGQLHVYVVPIHAVWYATPSGSALRPQAAFKPVILTSLHDMEGSRSFMQLYKHQYQLHGMLIKNGLGWGWDCWWDADSMPSDSDRHAKNLWLTIKYRPLTTSSCEGISRRERHSAASQCRRHEGGSSQGVSGRRRDSAASQRRGHEGGSS